MSGLEWEYAARGGNKSQGYKYSGSHSVSNVGWYTDNSNNTTHAVGTKSPNELGIYDMSGNVWEWCADWYGAYSSNAQTNPKGSDTSDFRVNRGGSWYYDAKYCRVSFRDLNTPNSHYYDLGFRLAL
ncbi:formylglycine-generating enzyme family protein [Bacteroides sp. 224]|uniref:formylglycine-generating enzyme family protein n=1 Tax=Bacteroides sp. 224 TaxID=2302936 RepID=UPI00351AF049